MTRQAPRGTFVEALDMRGKRTTTKCTRPLLLAEDTETRCRRCEGCTNNWILEWLTRGLCQWAETVANGGFAAALTLTYKDDYCPVADNYYDPRVYDWAYKRRIAPSGHGTFMRRIKDRTKKLLAEIGDKEPFVCPKFLVVWEVGDGGRPHWHMLLFIDADLYSRLLKHPSNLFEIALEKRWSRKAKKFVFRKVLLQLSRSLISPSWCDAELYERIEPEAMCLPVSKSIAAAYEHLGGHGVDIYAADNPQIGWAYAEPCMPEQVLYCFKHTLKTMRTWWRSYGGSYFDLSEDDPRRKLYRSKYRPIWTSRSLGVSARSQLLDVDPELEFFGTDDVPTQILTHQSKAGYSASKAPTSWRQYASRKLRGPMGFNEAGKVRKRPSYPSQNPLVLVRQALLDAREKGVPLRELGELIEALADKYPVVGDALVHDWKFYVANMADKPDQKRKG